MTYCPIPFIGVTVNSRGDCRMCCHSKVGSKQEFSLKKDGKRYNLKNDTLEDAFNSDQYKQLRSDMLEGIENDTCSKCYLQEKSGTKSPREMFLEKWGVIEEPKVKYADFRFSNLCNLKCRMCNPYSSSEWVSEEWNELSEKVDDPAYRKLNPIEMFDMTDPVYSWADEEMSKENLLKIVDTVEEIHFQGGEPTMIKANMDFLDTIIENGKAENISIRFITNLTNVPKGLLERFKLFKKVIVFGSLDAKGDLLRYIRYPANWEKLTSNVERIIETPNVTFRIDCTVTNYSVLRLDEFIEWVREKNIDIYMNILEWPACLDIRALPTELKKEMTDKLKKYEEAEGVIKYMLEKDLDKFEEFKEYTNHLDKNRKQNVLEVLPEYSKYFEDIV